MTVRTNNKSTLKFTFVTALFIFFAIGLQAQQQGWQLQDLSADSVFGISSKKAFSGLLKNKKGKKVIVAVIDAGIDTAHKDLSAIIWNNPKEKADGRDDDHNGYVDDLHGWNFLGPVGYDNLELTRQVRQSKDKFDGRDSVSARMTDQAGYAVYKKQKEEWMQQYIPAKRTLDGMEDFRAVLDTMSKNMGKDKPVLKDFRDYQPVGPKQTHVKGVMLQAMGEDDLPTFLATKFQPAFDQAKVPAKYYLNMDFDPRGLIGDDYFNSRDSIYGDNKVYGTDPVHGTHVAGIIGMIADNGLGEDALFHNVSIMAVRAVPEGDERDKDVANAIRYAVDNGATVINMSFGKAYGQDKQAVDEAVKYAMSRDVLLIHAAGNDNRNLDKETVFPNRVYADGSGEAGAWIEVGASGDKDNGGLKAGFSNYGAETVDLFAPGVHIYSTIPGSGYTYFDGTSMAAPVVSGIAALIRAYYPDLTATEVKEIILASVIKVTHPVTLQSAEGVSQVPFTQLCRTGGIANAYTALKMAEVRSLQNKKSKKKRR